jgi:hypothetical protein
MGRLRSLAAQAPSIAISVLALTLSLGGGAYAATHLSTHASAKVSATVALQNLTLVNGWKSSQSQFQSGNPKVGLANGVVYLAGSMHQATGTNGHFATLPQKFRPAHNMWLPVYTEDGTEGSLEIEANGQMFAFDGSAVGFTSLAGVSFPINS